MAYNLLHLAADGRDIAGLGILLARRGVFGDRDPIPASQHDL